MSTCKYIYIIVQVYTISGRGTVATGRLERGVVKKGDEALIMGHGVRLKTVITGQTGHNTGYGLWCKYDYITCFCFVLVNMPLPYAVSIRNVGIDA